MVEPIHEYLQQANPDFASGFRLFCTYSPNQSLMSFIGRKKDMQMLLYELRKIDESPVHKYVNPNATADEIRFNRFPASQAPAAAAPEAPQRPEIIFKTYDERRTSRAALPPEMQKIYDETTAEYKVRRAHHEKMKAARTDKDRAEHRAGILAAQERIAAGWKQIDTFLLEKEKAAQATSFNEKNCRSYISKALASKTISDRVAKGVTARVQALLDHGCVISEETQQLLRKRNLV